MGFDIPKHFWEFSAWLIFFYILFHKTPLYKAIENENIEMVKILLTNKNIDVNRLNIQFRFLIEFKISNFNYIQNHYYQLHPQ